MEINVTSVEKTTYRPLFASEDIGIVKVWVEIPEHRIVMMFTHRDDDPDGEYYADYRSDKGIPVFSHGEGERTVLKSVASGELLAAIKEAVA